MISEVDSLMPLTHLAHPPFHNKTLLTKTKTNLRGAWVAQLVKRATSAQVMISPSVGSSPALGSVLTAQSL